jgi:hypothetical protein
VAGEVSDNEWMPDGWRIGLGELGEGWGSELRAVNSVRSERTVQI